MKRKRLTETRISRQETIIVPKVASARSSDSYLRTRSEINQRRVIFRYTWTAYQDMGEKDKNACYVKHNVKYKIAYE